MISTLVKEETIVSLSSYLEFCSLRNNTIRKLKDKRFGESFCEFFNINDFFISNMTNLDDVKNLIETQYLSDLDQQALAMIRIKLGENKIW